VNEPLQVRYVPLGSLRPYERNAREHSEAQVAQIAASIERFGFNAPILVDDSGEIIAGHGRALAAAKLGIGEVPCIYLPHLTPQQKRAYVLADNKLALNSAWDADLLSMELSALQDDGFDLALAGFDDLDLARMIRSQGSSGCTDPDEAPVLPSAPFSQLGDIWQLGAHRVMCGDSTRPEQLKQLVDGQLVDLFLTDPPYNVAYEGKTKAALTIKNDSMADDSFRQFLRDAFAAADAVMKPGAVFYIWHADLEGFNFRAACRDVGWQVRQNLIWQKDSLVLGRQDYQSQHEPCLYGWKEGAAHLWASDRKQTTLLKFDRPKRNAEHPTMKPVELVAYQLLNSTRGGGIVLDSFGGSGTTLIAAQQHGRVARIMELDPCYVDVIVRRWQAYTGQAAQRLSDGACMPMEAAD
jgi:site-specific DNA-methyltransferase (adenine-specific)